MVLIDMLLEGKLEVVGVVAGTDGSRPDHYVFKPKRTLLAVSPLF
jgi:hypothetical protein